MFSSWVHSLSPQSSQSRKPYKDLMTPCGDKAVRCLKAHLWDGWQVMRKGGDGKREKRKSVLWVMLVKSFTANHTQDWFTAHFALLTHFSYHTFHCPISLFHQGQMKGMIAYTILRFIINGVTHLLCETNELLKSAFMKMDRSNSHVRRQQGRGTQSKWHYWTPVVSFPVHRIKAEPPPPLVWT